MLINNYECYHKWTPPPPHLFITAGLISYLSVVYLFAKLLELLIHRLGSPKCVVKGISGCSNIFAIKRNFMVTCPTGTFLVIKI